MIDVDHAVSLDVVTSAAAVQRAFGIEECCQEIIGVFDPSAPPATFQVLGNTPNPVRALTNIVFALPVEGGVVSLD